MAKAKPNVSEETDIVHGIHPTCQTFTDLVPPIHMTSTFKFNSAEHGASVFAGTTEGYIYTRISNPTTDMLQGKMALLEGGEAAIATASGMSAIASVALSLAKPGNNFVSCNSIYGGTFALFHTHLKDLNISARFISPSASGSPSKIEKLINKNTRFLFLETPANPTLDVIDIELWASIAKKHGLPLVVDNTFATPYLQKPLRLGADIVVHSATKYLGGHGDVIGGIIVSSDTLIRHIKESYVTHFGPIISPFNAWLILRGIKTLAIRMERHSDNAMKVARFLYEHPKVIKVHYPGLESCPNHLVAKKQMKKFGGMISFEVHGGITAGKRVMNNVNVCTLAVSLGDCETLIQHPASMTHSTYSPKDREKAGISDGLIRISVGLENVEDIIADLKSALSLVRPKPAEKKARPYRGVPVNKENL